MKTISTFILINTVFVVGQLVAATTVMIMAPTIKAMIPNANQQVWPWFILMVGATALAINVVRSALR